MNFIDQFDKLDLNIHGVRLPSFKVNNKDKRQLGVSEDICNEDFLEALCENGLQKFKLDGSEYRERLNHELKTVKELGFVDYLLLVYYGALI